MAKETTTQSINNRILTTELTIKVYSNLISQPETKSLNIVLPDYLRLLLELFVYSEYNLIITGLNLNEVNITTDYIANLIPLLKEAEHKAVLDKLLPKQETKDQYEETAITNIFDLNQLPQQEPIVEPITNNNQLAIEKFLKLFEDKKPKVTTGGGKKKHTRKKKRHHKKRRSTRRYR